MSKPRNGRLQSEYGPFTQIDSPATGSIPASSSFDAVMPVDLHIEGVSKAVKETIPGALTDALDRGANIAEYTSLQPVHTLSIVREIGLLNESLNFSEALNDFRRYERAIGKLATSDLNDVRVLIYERSGKLIEYSVAGEPLAGSGKVDELFASVNHADGPDEYYMRRNVLAPKPPEPIPVSADDALDFLRGLSERQNGETAPLTEAAILKQLYEASTHRYKHQEMNRQTNGQSIEYAARMTTIALGDKAVKSYWLKVAQGLPGGKTLSAKLNVGMPKRNRQIYPTANLSMTIFDTPQHRSTPAKRAADFEEIFMLYREKPEEFFGMLSKAAYRLAELAA